jgi:hypothetical protein
LKTRSAPCIQRADVGTDSDRSINGVSIDNIVDVGKRYFRSGPPLWTLRPSALFLGEELQHLAEDGTDSIRSGFLLRSGSLAHAAAVLAVNQGQEEGSKSALEITPY